MKLALLNNDRLIIKNGKLLVQDADRTCCCNTCCLASDATWAVNVDILSGTLPGVYAAGVYASGRPWSVTEDNKIRIDIDANAYVILECVNGGAPPEPPVYTPDSSCEMHYQLVAFSCTDGTTATLTGGPYDPGGLMSKPCYNGNGTPVMVMQYTPVTITPAASVTISLTLESNPNKCCCNDMWYGLKVNRDAGIVEVSISDVSVAYVDSEPESPICGASSSSSSTGFACEQCCEDAASLIDVVQGISGTYQADVCCAPIIVVAPDQCDVRYCTYYFCHSGTLVTPSCGSVPYAGRIAVRCTADGVEANLSASNDGASGATPGGSGDCVCQPQFQSGIGYTVVAPTGGVSDGGSGPNECLLRCEGGVLCGTLVQQGHLLFTIRHTEYAAGSGHTEADIVNTWWCNYVANFTVTLVFNGG